MHLEKKRCCQWYSAEDGESENFPWLEAISLERCQRLNMKKVVGSTAKSLFISRTNYSSYTWLLSKENKSIHAFSIYLMSFKKLLLNHPPQSYYWTELEGNIRAVRQKGWLQQRMSRRQEIRTEQGNFVFPQQLPCNDFLKLGSFRSWFGLSLPLAMDGGFGSILGQAVPGVLWAAVCCALLTSASFLLSQCFQWKISGKYLAPLCSLLPRFGAPP